VYQEEYAILEAKLI
jgi:dynein heavy chain, axonemal